ncbi:hypothetical protein F7Q90_25000 [Pantoea stewartii subsp. stewartii]|nr:hypothetical protein F7Q90_25000 [Pantoea stewartii subsp. stewartii]
MLLEFAQKKAPYTSATNIWSKYDTSGLQQWRVVNHHKALLNKWILCCGTMKTVVSDNIKSMHYMLAYDGVLSGISVFYQNSADKTE